ncbi:uncharacterized protein BXIN_2569 [Babesia sp. Xinjiang]|uniref:uncharacterized protein n=1 Tax=Babesia sp. Xinjiang TaxID=462227 RepID=UPI000A2411B6|nr:uncharacterized protein BXIN_2569 [Babesia sp. Xinjiang]ORM41476.1 hypothetical protein BXIN_2569 [Babesia sp. Xinjiang]
MDAADRAKYCRERLEALRLELPRIARVLHSADEHLERRRGPQGLPPSVAQIRISMLKTSVQRLRQARDRLKPAIEGAMELVECINRVAESAANLRRRLAHIQRSTVHAEMERLSAQISLTEKRLLALNCLMGHLNPSMTNVDYNSLEYESHAGDPTISGMERVLEAAESLMESKRFCDSLQELEFLKGSPVIHEATQRLATNLDSSCELSFLWLQKESRRLSTSLCDVFKDASAVALRHSTGFIPPVSGDHLINDKLGLRSILEQSDESDENEKPSIALRALRLLKLRPTYLYHFLAGMRDILGHVSLNSFAAYTSAVKMDAYNRTAVLECYLNHLQNTVTFMRRCVEHLYSNAGVPLDAADLRWHGVVFLTADRYLRHILTWLVIPLESKLNHVMQENAISVIEGIINYSSIVYMFDAIQIVDSHVKRLKVELETPWNGDATPSGIVIDGLEVPKETGGSAMRENSDKMSLDSVIATGEGETQIEETVDSVSQGKPEGTVDVENVTLAEDESQAEFVLDCDTEKTEDETDVDYEYDIGESEGEEDAADPLISKLVGIHSEWRRQLFASVKQRIEDPLLSEDTYELDTVTVVDIAAPHVVHSISEFIVDIITVQSRHDSSDDFMEMLDLTLKSIMGWCNRSAEKYGDNANAYLINCYAVLMQALSSEIVPASFRESLQLELRKNVDCIVETLSTELATHLGLDEAKSDINKREVSLRRISALVLGDGIMSCDLSSIKRLKLITDKYQMVIRGRIYRLLVEGYSNLADDSDSHQVRELREFASKLSY